jgi:hypothetical protein
MTPLQPIPIPAARRWKEFRIRVLPVLVFVGALGLSAFLWRQVALQAVWSAQIQQAVIEVNGRSRQGTSVQPIGAQPPDTTDHAFAGSPADARGLTNGSPPMPVPGLDAGALPARVLVHYPARSHLVSEKGVPRQ